jgi:hypothetical protein
LTPIFRDRMNWLINAIGRERASRVDEMPAALPGGAGIWRGKLRATIGALAVGLRPRGRRRALVQIR